MTTDDKGTVARFSRLDTCTLSDAPDPPQARDP